MTGIMVAGSASAARRSWASAAASSARPPAFGTRQSCGRPSRVVYLQHVACCVLRKANRSVAQAHRGESE
jgi:hypothetical protein